MLWIINKTKIKKNRLKKINQPKLHNVKYQHIQIFMRFRMYRQKYILLESFHDLQKTIN